MAISYHGNGVWNEGHYSLSFARKDFRAALDFHDRSFRLQAGTEATDLFGTEHHVDQKKLFNIVWRVAPAWIQEAEKALKADLLAMCEKAGKAWGAFSKEEKALRISENEADDEAPIRHEMDLVVTILRAVADSLRKTQISFGVYRESV
jgi:hypothetical protein